MKFLKMLLNPQALFLAIYVATLALVAPVAREWVARSKTDKPLKAYVDTLSGLFGDLDKAMARRGGLHPEAGIMDMGSMVKTLILVLVGVLIGLILIPIIIASAITAAGATGIGSFAGVAALIGLIPVLFVLAPIALSVGAAVYFFQKYKGD